MYKAEITKEQSWIWAIGWEVHRGLWTQVTWTKPVQHVSVFPLLSFCPWSFILMKIVIKQLVISLVHDVQILTSHHLPMCVAYLLVLGPLLVGWVNFRWVAFPLVEKPELRALCLAVDTVITEMMGGKILVEVCAVLPKSGKKEADLAYVMKPSGLQQGRHVAASAPVVVENRVTW